MSATFCTALGLCFALVVTRTDWRWKRALRALTLLPIITPPFVIGLALILLLGRNGALTTFVANAFGVVPGRWVYGFFGVWLGGRVFDTTGSYAPVWWGSVVLGVVAAFLSLPIRDLSCSGRPSSPATHVSPAQRSTKRCSPRCWRSCPRATRRSG